MKIFLVCSSPCVLVGIEKCQAFIVSQKRLAAFRKQFAGRILVEGFEPASLPGVRVVVYSKAR